MIIRGAKQPKSDSKRGTLQEGSLLKLVGTDTVQPTTLTRKVTYAGNTVVYPVYKVRLDALYYNDQNDRILIGGLTSAYAISYRRFRNEVNIGRSEEDYVRYPYRRRPKDIRKRPTDSMWLDDFVNEKGCKILLSHHPEYWCMREPMLSRRKIDLVVSGHAHGGQWAVSGRGVYAPGQGLLPKYTRGIHYGPYGRMIVSRGMTNPYDFAPRWGNPCEVVYIQFE